MAIYSFLFDIKIGGIPLIIIAILFAGIFILLRLRKRGKKEAEFKKVSLKEVIERENWERLTVFGFPTNNLIRIGSRYIGKVKGITPFSASQEKLDFSKKPDSFRFKKKDIDKIEKTPKEKIGFNDLFLMKIQKLGFINTLKALFLNAYSFFIINAELVSFKNQEIEINPNHEADNYFNVWVFSDIAKDFIDRISFKETLKTVLEAQINFLPKMEFNENQLAKSIAIFREKALIEKEKYKGQTEASEEG